MIRETSPLQFYSHGKLLLTGEYVVLDGAWALAVPTRQGQFLAVKRENTGRQKLRWNSFTAKGQIWFAGVFELPDGKYLEGTDDVVGRRLEQIFSAAQVLKPALWDSTSKGGYTIRTDLEFPRQWGLGTSSTLIANLARWWEVDAHQLLAATFGGSGYDLACATAEGPLFYQLQGSLPKVQAAAFAPPFAAHLYFLYLERKQDSRSGIAHYRQSGKVSAEQIRRISALSRQATAATDLEAFQQVMEEHENSIAGLIGTSPIKDRLFSDFPGAVKSLGAWGGDFVLVAAKTASGDLKRYFANRGFPTLIPFDKMVLRKA